VFAYLAKPRTGIEDLLGDANLFLDPPEKDW